MNVKPKLNLDKLKKKLSTHQYITLLEYVANGNFSLEKLNLLIVDSQKRIKRDNDDISAIDRFLSGIQINILGRIRFSPSDSRTPHQKTMLQKYNVPNIQQSCEDFRTCLQEFIQEEKNKLNMIQQIKEIYIDNYPQALESPPNTPRAQLENSPARFMLKSHSSPTLSPRSSGIFKSPRRSKSHKKDS